MSASNELLGRIAALLAEKFEKRLTKLGLTTSFVAVEDEAFRKLGRRQTRQILRSTLGSHRLSDTNAEHNIEPLFSKTSTGRQGSLLLRTQSKFQASMYLHFPSFLEILSRDKGMMVLITYETEIQTSFAAQLVCDSWGKGHWRQLWKPEQLHSAISVLLIILQIIPCSTSSVWWLRLGHLERRILRWWESAAIDGIYCSARICTIKQYRQLFMELSVFYLLHLLKRLSGSLSYKPFDIMLPQWSKAKMFLTESGPPPQCPHFPSSLAQIFKVSRFAPSADSVLTVRYENVVGKRALRRKRLLWMISFSSRLGKLNRSEGTPWLEEKGGKTAGGFWWVNSFLECTALVFTLYIHVKLEDVKMQDSCSGRSSAKVGILNAFSNSTVPKNSMTTYCRFLDVRFQDLLEVLEVVSVISWNGG